jgi:hypothetical protein
MQTISSAIFFDMIGCYLDNGLKQTFWNGQTCWNQHMHVSYFILELCRNLRVNFGCLDLSVHDRDHDRRIREDSVC